MLFYHADYVQTAEYDKIKTKLETEGLNFLHKVKNLKLESFHNIQQSRKSLLKDKNFKKATKELLAYAQKFKIDKDYIYTMMRIRANEYYFILIGEGKYSLTKKSDTFKISAAVRPYFDKAYDTGKIQYPPPYTDSKGKWLTIVIPMIGKNGNVYAIHEPALKLKKVDKIINAARLSSIYTPIGIFGGSLLITWLLLNILFRPFNNIVTIFSARKEKSLDLKKVKASGEFAILRDTLDHYITETQKAQGETRNILDAVDEGLFLLDHEFIVGAQYSAALTKIIDQEPLGGQSFLKILTSLVSPKVISSTTDFLDLMFQEGMAANVLTDLNPLHEVQVKFEAENQVSFKYLQFRFARISFHSKSKSIEPPTPSILVLIISMPMPLPESRSAESLVDKPGTKIKLASCSAVQLFISPSGHF